MRKAIVVFVAMLGIACGSSPTAPTVVVPPAPQPVAGTSTIDVPLAGQDHPFQIWIEALNPGLGGQLVLGMLASITWTCSGPPNTSLKIHVEQVDDNGAIEDAGAGTYATRGSGACANVDSPGFIVDSGVNSHGVTAWRFTATTPAGDISVDQAVNWLRPSRWRVRRMGSLPPRQAREFLRYRDVR